MNVECRFFSIPELESNPIYQAMDFENILSTGLDLYKTSILQNPYYQKNNPVVCLAITDERIVGRYMLFYTRLKLGTDVSLVRTGGGIVVSEKYRGQGIGLSLIRTVLNSEFYFGALYTRAAYNIVRKTEAMLEIPQYVRFTYHGLKKVLNFPILIKTYLLKRRTYIERLSKVPDWVNQMIKSEQSKYMEDHDVNWLQWTLDNNATPNVSDYQSFYAVYNKKGMPIGFFMTKTRTIVQDGHSHKKVNLVEWASSDISLLDEADINILAFSTLDSSIEKFWTISNSAETGNKLKRYFFNRKGWFAISVNSDEKFPDIGNKDLWRIRYGCANTALVE
jgi:GNAT superfamily N-acetyltransferase